MLFFQNILTNPIISEIKFLKSSHFETQSLPEPPSFFALIQVEGSAKQRASRSGTYECCRGLHILSIFQRLFL